MNVYQWQGVATDDIIQPKQYWSHTVCMCIHRVPKQTSIELVLTCGLVACSSLRCCLRSDNNISVN